MSSDPFFVLGLIAGGIPAVEGKFIMSEFQTWWLAFSANQAISTTEQIADAVRKWRGSIK